MIFEPSGKEQTRSFSVFSGSILQRLKSLIWQAISIWSLLFVFDSAGIAATDIEIFRAASFDKWKRKRPVRKETRFIVLHTTEGGYLGSLRHLEGKGAAHYLIALDGSVRHIVYHRNVAYHAGHSMWNGHRGLNRSSIGIEFVGWHYKRITDEQIRAAKELIRQLQDIYDLGDQSVLTHSMVAYGKYNGVYFRGRKDCALNLANDLTRHRMGLDPIQKDDPDVPHPISGWDIHHQYMERLIYGNWSYQFPGDFGSRMEFVSTVEDLAPGEYRASNNTITKYRSAWSIARDLYDEPTTIYSFPNGRKFRGSDIRDWSSLPEGTEVTFINCSENLEESCTETSDLPMVDNEESRPEFLVIGDDGQTAWELAKNNFAKQNTLYFIPYSKNYFRVFTGSELNRSESYDINRLPQGTRILLSYVFGGHVTPQRKPLNIVGRHWNSSSTLYYERDTGRIYYGDDPDFDSRKIRPNTLVLFRDRFSDNS